MGLKFKPDTDYKVRIRYRADGLGQLNLSVHTLAYKNGVFKAFPATGDKWTTVELRIHRAIDPLRLTVAAGGAAGSQLAISSVELVEIASEKARFQLDLAAQEPFVVRSGITVDPNDPNRKTYRPVSQTGTGALPAGWTARCYNKDTEMEAFSEVAEGLPALGIRNATGPGSAMLLMPRVTCPSGLCRLWLEYSANVRGGTFIVRFKPDDQRPAFDVARPPVSGTGWRSEEIIADLKGASGGVFEFHNTDSAPNASVRFRDVVVIEPNPVSLDRVVFKLDAADLPMFRNAKRGKSKTTGDDDPPLTGIYLGGWKPETESEWTCKPYMDVKAIGFTNLNDVVSAQIGIELEAANGKALKFAQGQIIRITATYRTTGKARGSLYVQNADDKKVPDRANMPTSNGSWRTVELVTVRGSNPLRCLVDVSEHGEGNTLYVKSVTVAEVGKAGQAPKTNPPPKSPSNPNDPVTWAEGPNVYSLDISKIPAFRVQKEKGTRIGGESEQLPEGIGCGCWKDKGVGEFRRGTHDSSDALGLTNLNDEKSAQFYFTLERGMKLPLQPGKAYRVKVSYRTENDASGSMTVQIVPGYTRHTSANLPASNTQWKAVAMSFIRPPEEDNVELRMVIDNFALGEGNTIWVRSLEIVELIPPLKK